MAKEKAAEAVEDMVSITILKASPKHAVGDIVDVPLSEAQKMIAVTLVRDGESLVEHRKAMLTSEAVKMKNQTVDISKMTQAEMHQLGLKNVVATPKDSMFEKYMNNIAEKGKASNELSRAAAAPAQDSTPEPSPEAFGADPEKK